MTNLGSIRCMGLWCCTEDLRAEPPRASRAETRELQSLTMGEALVGRHVRGDYEDTGCVGCRLGYISVYCSQPVGSNQNTLHLSLSVIHFYTYFPRTRVFVAQLRTQRCPKTLSLLGPCFQTTVVLLDKIPLLIGSPSSGPSSCTGSDATPHRPPSNRGSRS